LRRAVIASTVGTTIEWYDFFLYSIVTGLVFAKLYFPEVGTAGRYPESLAIKFGEHQPRDDAVQEEIDHSMVVPTVLR